MKMKFAALLLVGLMVWGAMAFADFANAGSEQTPEVTDPEGDASTLTTQGTQYFDVLAAWFDSDGKNLITSLKIADLTGVGSQANLMAGGDGAVYYVRFTIKDKSWFTSMSVTATGTTKYDYGYVDATLGNSVVGSIEGTYTNAAPGIITMKAPLGNFGLKKTGALTDTQGETDIYRGVPEEIITGGLVNVADDTEMGKDYTLGSSPETANPAVEFSFDGTVEAQIGKTASFDVIATNTQNISASITVSANISENWVISPISTQITVDAKGNQTITYTVTAPASAKVGDTATITITGGKSPLVVTVKAVSEPSNGGTGKTPGFEMLGLLGAIGVAAVLLRRKK
ncbi:MAG: hypothetical protein PHH26_03340 [Candidatus Thermoplasmatota archaeon]|nr:hypothetical protein [Candidatus Thermoplasmatota archaeon]